MMPQFEILDEIKDVEVIAAGRGVYIRRHLERVQVGDRMSRFVICIDNSSNPASLIVGKVYRVVPDTEAETHHMVRIIDEDRSEPDGYLYPASAFVPIELPTEAERALIAAGA